MLEATSIAAQIAAAKNDTIRVLVVGAGIAGITIAQMLRCNGLHPVLAERAAPDANAGYMLALMPMIDPVIHDLGVRESYLSRSAPLHRYGFRSHLGKPLREDTLEDILERFGDYRGISRPELIETLSAHGCPVSFNTTITSLRETATRVVAIVSSIAGDVEEEFDLVIVADGIHSTTRALVLGEDVSLDVVDTKWGGWVAWMPMDDNGDLGEELWGAGFFIGIYPVADKLGVFVGGPRADTAAGPAQFSARTRAKLRTCSTRFAGALDAIGHDEDAYYWSLTDCRSPRWVKGRVVLLGDAAAGFLPTAGIGAGMAMESAWVLARILRHADPSSINSLLHAYEATQRPRVEAAQDTSRWLARLMLQRSTALASVRDIALRMVSIQAALKPIQRLLATRPEPDRVAVETIAVNSK